MLGVRIFDLIDVRTNIHFQIVEIDNKFVLEIEGDELARKLIVSSPGRAFTGPFAASDEVEFIYEVVIGPIDEPSISFEAVAVGQMPQGCEIQVDADANFVIEPVPP